MKRKFIIFIGVFVAVAFFTLLASTRLYSSAVEETTVEALEGESLDLHTGTDREQNDYSGAITSPLVPILSETLALSEDLV